MKRSLMHRLLAFVMVLAMVFTMVPASAFATEPVEEITPVTESVEITETAAAETASSESEASETPTTEAAETEPEATVAPFANGDTVVIYAPGYMKALSATKTGNYNVGVDVTIDGETMSGYGETELWTVIANDDGTYSFANGGQNIAMADSYSSMNLGETNDKWELVDLGDGLYNVLNVGRNTYMEWYDKYSNWSTYNSSSAATDPQFQIGFYIVPTEPELPLTNGETVVIYAPGYMKALSATKTGNYNVGVDVTIDGETMSGYGETELWTVIANDDGTYSFANGGQNIAMADSYSSMNLGETNDKWELVDLGDGLYNVLNVGRNTYMEWYDKYSNWSTYNSSSAATDPQFQIAFFSVKADDTTDPTDPTDPTEPEEPETPESSGTFLVTDVTELAVGDQIVIVAAESDAALGTTQNNNNRAEAAVTKDGDAVTYGEDVQIITLEEGTVAGTFAMNVGDGYLYAASSSKNYLRTEEAKSDNGAWTITIDENGIATIKSNGEYERNWLRYNKQNNPPIFACYKSGQQDVKIYKVVVAEEETPVIVDPITDDMIEEGVLNIKEALATTGEATVIGQVVYHYGNAYNGAASINSIILEDIVDGEIVGFQVYDYTNYANYVVGDVVKITGTITNYKGVMQMSFPTMEVVKTGAEPIPAQVVTVSQLGADYLSEYVYIQDVTLGTYNASGSTTVTDSTGSINLFKGVPLAENITEADVIAVYAACSVYNTTYQLRNGSSADYVTEEDSSDESGIVAEGDKVVIFNVSAQGVLSLQDDNETSPSVTNVAATVEDGKATVNNGGLVFTVSRNGDYYRFYNETYGYLCSNGTGSNAFYQLEVSEDADWLLAEYNGGYSMESRTAKYNGKYSQFLEYYAGSYKTYSMYNVTDKDIYTFQFYPCANEDAVSGGVVNAPAVVFGTLLEAQMGMEYSFRFSVDAPFGVAEIAVAVNETAMEAAADSEGYAVTVPVEAVTGEKLTITVTGTDTLGKTFTGTAEVTVVDEPVITDMAPAAGTQTGDEKKPTISAKIINGGEEPTVTMTVAGAEVAAVYADGTVSYTPEEALADGRTTVTVTVTRADGKTASKTWIFTVGKAQYELFFGQLHSHTTYSDGSGSLEDALDYIKNLPDSANVDFVAFTDHSNYFDTSSAANPEGALYDMSLATAYSQETWSAYKSAIASFNEANTDIIAIGGFEMTWSGGPGHLNTFNTPGIVSRNNTTLNNKTSDAGMKAYYALLSSTEGVDSVTQFNHPGSTFGTFSDFAYWDPVVDDRIQLVEVGNGEGQIGAGGYYPSYEYYTMALDKGWHVAPTNNQDNHKGKWGNANEARDVILTDDFTEQGLYEAMRKYRVYATEDKNLEIYYTVNGQMLGSIIEEVPEQLDISVSVVDPDAADSISKVEIIVNSGKTAYTWSDPETLASGVLSCTLSPDYSYYYVRVTEGDGDIAVTAPVWVGDTLKLGISAVECGTSTPVTGEELTITTTLFNSEITEAKVKSLVYTTNGGEVLATDNAGYTIPASGTVSAAFNYTPSVAKVMKITVTAVVELEGIEYTFTMDIELDVQDADRLVYIGIDASHYNEYVAGNYKDSMGNFGALAAGYSVRTVELKTSADLIAACSNEKYKALLLTAPSRRLPAAQEALLTYTAEELAAIKAFNANGGVVILAGWSDHYEYYPSVASIAGMTADQHMAATQNKVLETLGSSLRIGDDATYDDSYNGGQAYRLYFNTYNYDSFLVSGVEVDEANPHDRLYTEVFSYYGGASVYTVDGTLPETVTPVVYGHSTTYSVDVDKDGLGGDTVPKYAYAEGDNRLMAVATEELPGQGLIIVSGAAFMSNFEVQATIEDSGSEKNYANYKVCENLSNYLNPTKITTIAEVRAQTEVGYKYTVEGVVTSNASGYDKETAFFDCIYVQDATGGICCFPVAGNYKVGDKVRITGTTEFYQGEPELQVSSIEVIGEGTVEPTAITAAELNDRSAEGKLVTLTGVVESFEYANGMIQTIMVKDAEGNVARVFIDGYISTAEDVDGVELRAAITVTGLASYDDTFNAPEGPFPRIRVRNRADVICGYNPADYNVFARKSLTLKEINPETGKAYTSKQITWSMDSNYEPFATVSKTGRITGKNVVERSRIEVVGTVKATQETVTYLVDIFPKVTQLEVKHDDSIVNGKTVYMDFTEESITLNAVAHPLDLNDLQSVTWKVNDKKEAYAQYDASGNTLVISNPTGKAGTVTVTATINAGVKKTVTLKVSFGCFAKTVVIDPLEKTELKGGETMTLTAKITEPETVTKPGIVWSVSNKLAASITTAGKLTAKNVAHPTEVVVTATSKDGKASASVTVTILPKSDAALVLMNGNSFVTNGKKALNVGESYQLNALLVNNGETEAAAVTWTSENEKVATVENGLVTAVAAGTAKITAADETGRKASFTVTVSTLVAGMEVTTKDGKNLIEEKGETIAIVSSGKTLALKANILTEGARKTVTWKITEGAEFAKIAASGTLTANRNLTSVNYVTVQATAKDGSGITASLKVKIVPLATGVQIYQNGIRVRSNTTYIHDMEANPVVKLSAKVYPAKAQQSFQWTSSNKKIAEFIDGELVCHKAGIVTITAKALDGSGAKTTFKLKVVKLMTDLTLKDDAVLSVTGGKSLKLASQLVISPSDTTNKKLTWSVQENEYGIKINATTGVLTTKKVTETVTVNVMAIAKDGSGKMISFDVTVNPA